MKKKKFYLQVKINITFEYDLIQVHCSLTSKLSCIDTIQINLSLLKNITKEHYLITTSNMAIFDDNH